VQVFDNDSHPLDADLRERDYLSLIGRQPGPRQSVATAPIVIGECSWIGFNVAILKGVQIGDGAVIAAASVVTHDIPAWSMAAGNPAHVIKELPHTQ
jgi:acetyltransferase-like isoleucine patch superfamily enzyme